MDKPYLIHTGATPVCAPHGSAHPELYPLREGFEHEFDVIDAPEAVPAGGVRVQQTTNCAPWMTQHASRD